METNYIIQSVFKKGERICKVKSVRGAGQKKATFTFTGYNPFPCYEMVSTFISVSNWMKANGWERVPGGFRKIETDEINPETGELL